MSVVTRGIGGNGNIASYGLGGSSFNEFGLGLFQDHDGLFEGGLWY